MELTNQEKETINYYDDNAREWSEKHGMDGKNLMFDHFMRLLFQKVPDGRILEVGTGHGGDAKKLIEHYGAEKFVGCDPSAGLLKIAKQRNPGAKFTDDTVYSLNFPDNYFDAFWASAVLIHLPKNKLETAMNNLYRTLRTGGYGFISVLEGDADMHNSRPGRFYSLWKETEFKKSLKSSGFEVEAFERIETKASPWLLFLVKKV